MLHDRREEDYGFVLFILDDGHKQLYVVDSSVQWQVAHIVYNGKRTFGDVVYLFQGIKSTLYQSSFFFPL
jgi:hypothetical protein